MRKVKILLALGIALSPLAATVFNTDVAYGNQTITKNQTGWIKEGNTWYYKNSQGQNVRSQWVGNYYLKADGKMAVNEWTPDGYYVDGSGAWVPGKTKNQTGWVKEGNTWYYKNSQGQNVRSQWIGNYYLKADGKMATNEWIYDNNYKSYYYLGGSGVYVKNIWQGDYYLKADGKMALSEWIGSYYVNESGKKVVNEWLYDNNYKSHYYLKETGIYATNEWVGGYYLKVDGKMATNEWIYDNIYKAYYYIKENGIYAVNYWKDNYYLKADGKMAVNEWLYDYSKQAYFYVNKEGSIVKNSWIEGKYFLGNDGKMLVNTWTPDNYFVDKNGKLAQGYVSENGIVKYFVDGKIANGTYNGKKYVNGMPYYNHFQFKDIRSTSNYTAEELNRVIAKYGGSGSKLYNKGSIFKEAEKEYKINALYLLSHAALESGWGTSKIAKDKNNFFGITAYDDSAYESATKWDDIDKGILLGAKWISGRYIYSDKFPASGAYLGDKSRGMNKYYATEPEWGYRIARIMTRINNDLGNKDN